MMDAATGATQDRFEHAKQTGRCKNLLLAVLRPKPRSEAGKQLQQHTQRQLQAANHSQSHAISVWCMHALEETCVVLGCIRMRGICPACQWHACILRMHVMACDACAEAVLQH